MTFVRTSFTNFFGSIAIGYLLFTLPFERFGQIATATLFMYYVLPVLIFRTKMFFRCLWNRKRLLAYNKWDDSANIYLYPCHKSIGRWLKAKGLKKSELYGGYFVEHERCVDILRNLNEELGCRTQPAEL